MNLHNQETEERLKLTIKLYGINMQTPIQADGPEARELVHELKGLVDVSVETDYTMYACDVSHWLLVLSFVGGGLAAGILSSIGEDIWKSIKNLLRKISNKKLPTSLFHQHPRITIVLVIKDVQVKAYMEEIELSDKLRPYAVAYLAGDHLDVAWERLPHLIENAYSEIAREKLSSSSDEILFPSISMKSNGFLTN